MKILCKTGMLTQIFKIYIQVIQINIIQSINIPQMNGTHINGTTPNRNLTKQIFGDNQQLIRTQVEKLGQVQNQIKKVYDQIGYNKSKCQTTINNLNADIAQLDKKISTYQSVNNSSAAQDQIRTQITSLQQENLSICKERVKLASQISVKNLKKIHIEDKQSPANEVFKWVLGTIYTQPDNKYFWPNFKEEAFGNDKGQDFIQRLGKVSAMNVKQEQKIKTEQFIQNYPTYASSPELQKYRGETDKIFQIAKCFKKGYTISGNIKEHETNIAQHRQSTLDKDEQFMRWKAKSEALKDRVQINSKYLKTLEQLQTKIAPKVQLYSQKHESSQVLLREFENFGSKLQSQPLKWQPSVDTKMLTNPNTTGQCQCTSCSIF